MKRKLQVVACLMLTLVASSAIHAQAQWKVAHTFPIGGEGGWDYVTVDSQTHRLYVTRSTHTQVIDAESGKVLGDIPGQERSHGVAIVPKLNRGFITDGGGSGSIVVFDLTSYAVLGKIPTMPDSDGIIYDAKLDKVLAVSGDGGVLMTFRPDTDPKSGKADQTCSVESPNSLLLTEAVRSISTLKTRTSLQSSI